MEENNKSYPKKRNVLYMPDFGRVPPQCVDIEESVLGTIICNYHYISKYPYLKPECFYKDANQKIYSSLIELYKHDKKPDLLILQDYLTNAGLLDIIGGIIYLVGLTGKELAYIDNYVKIIIDKWLYREFIKIASEIQNKSFEQLTDPIDIADEFQSKIIDTLDFTGEMQGGFLKSLKMTIENIKAATLGINITTIKSGFKGLDTRITFRSKYICIIAGPEGSGKTKFVIALIRGMLQNEPNVAIEWFSMEDDREQVIRSFMAMDLKITTKELQSINYKLTETDIHNIDKKEDEWKDYNIEFYDRITSISTMISRSKRFAERNKFNKKIIVIDNLGLIDSEKSGIEKDDYLAAKIKNIADTTNSFIFVVHHFTKEIARKINIEDGYRPRKEYLKGSTRILDYVQQALFVNLPRKYPDLLAEEKQIELNFIGSKDMDFTEANFDKYLWEINPQGDRQTIGVTDLRIETLVKIRNLLNLETKDYNGKVLTFADLVQKYTEYSSHIDRKNKGREEKYIEKKASIFSFIVRRMFNENYVTNIHSPRSLYLYGRNPNLKNQIDDLFIVESVKNRDDDNINENTLYRFIVDLGYNIFKELDYNGNTIDNS